MRLVDSFMTEFYGVQLEEMMEMAGISLADLAIDLFGIDSKAKIIEMCGGGNIGITQNWIC